MERRQRLLDILKASDQPILGSHLADLLSVSRQTIVLDIAFLRKDGVPIISTPQGYLLTGESKSGYREVLEIVHSRDDLKRELEILVAHHVTIEDVFIDHPVYGRIQGNLNISTPKDLKQFLEKRSHSSIPLFSEVTGGHHYHTLFAEDRETILEAKEALRKVGFEVIR